MKLDEKVKKLEFQRGKCAIKNRGVLSMVLTIMLFMVLLMPISVKAEVSIPSMIKMVYYPKTESISQLMLWQYVKGIDYNNEKEITGATTDNEDVLKAVNGNSVEIVGTGTCKLTFKYGNKKLTTKVNNTNNIFFIYSFSFLCNSQLRLAASLNLLSVSFTLKKRGINQYATHKTRP